MRLPPYGRQLYELRKTHKEPIYNIYLYVGMDAWELAAERAQVCPDRIMCIPPFIHPKEYDFPVKDCGVLVLGGYEYEMDYIEDVVLTLFSQGAIAVTVSYNAILNPTHRLLFFKKDLKNV